MSWKNNLTVTFKSKKILEWEVCGTKGEGDICEFVNRSPGWRQFLQWRETIPKNEWGLILVDQNLSFT